jgi:hypothetical protein
MSYPEPIPQMTAEELYQQAMFFYRQYEEIKMKYRGMKTRMETLAKMNEVERSEGKNPIETMSELLSLLWVLGAGRE